MRDIQNMGYLARQPIIGPGGKTFGYELLCRAAVGDPASTTGDDAAAARVLSETVLNIGLDTVTAGLPAFVKLTRPLLMNDAATLLPPANTVLELSGDIAADDDVVDACHRLRSLGYVLALDDFVAGSNAEALLPFAKFVKVDVVATPEASWDRLARRLEPQGVRLIAEKAETAETVSRARAAGATLFQGYFFCKPTALGTSVALPARRVVYVHLIAALGRDDLTVAALEDLVKHDVSLTYRVLRSVNSAAFGLRRDIDSLRQALVLLGLQQIRKWAMVWALAGINTSAPETVVVALLRARTCELIGDALSDSSDMGSGFFIAGLCSLLDAMLGQTMPEALGDLPLPAPVRAALFGESNMHRLVLDLVIAYERADWDRTAALAHDAGVDVAAVPQAYARALEWARVIS